MSGNMPDAFPADPLSPCSCGQPRNAGAVLCPECQRWIDAGNLEAPPREPTDREGDVDDFNGADE